MTPGYELNEANIVTFLATAFDTTDGWSAEVRIGAGAIIEHRRPPKTTLERLTNICEEVFIRAYDIPTRERLLTMVIEALKPIADPVPDPTTGDVVRYTHGLHDVALIPFYRRI